MKSSLVLALCILGYLAVGSQSVVFATPPGPCVEDRQKFCNDVKPGAGRVFECLKNYKDQLSDACKKRIDEMSQEFEKLTNACSVDLAKYCGQVKSGHGIDFVCLKGGDDRLSAGCRSALRGTSEDVN